MSVFNMQRLSYTHNVHFVCCNMLIYIRINDMLELVNITQVTSEEL